MPQTALFFDCLFHKRYEYRSGDGIANDIFGTTWLMVVVTKYSPRNLLRTNVLRRQASRINSAMLILEPASFLLQNHYSRVTFLSVQEPSYAEASVSMNSVLESLYMQKTHLPHLDLSIPVRFLSPIFLRSVLALP